jgi:hypothetical protein
MLPELKAQLQRGEPIILGVDYYALSKSRELLPPEFIDRFGAQLARGEVMRIVLVPKDGMLELRILDRNK